MKRLFLIDAYAMIYRAFYSMFSSPMVNSKGESTSAAYGFVNSLLEIIKKEAPTHIGVVFDPPYPTFRNIISPDYKAQRPPTPEGIKTCIPYIRQILEAWGINMVEVANYEADDIIGTLAIKAANEDFQVFMVTPDKDYNQLLNNNIQIYRPKKGIGADIITEQSFLDENQLTSPKQFIDILALWGDAADNVKGVEGVGEKTAYKLIRQYGSIENIYNHIDELKGKQKENFIKCREQAELAKKLVTIVTDAPVDFVADDFIKKETDETALRNVFAQLEFKNVLERVIGKKQNATYEQGSLFATLNDNSDNQPAPTNFSTIATTKHDYILVDNQDKLLKLADELSKLNEFCFDTETTGLNVIDCKLVGMSFSYQAHKAYFIHFGSANDLDTNYVINTLKPIFENENITKVGQNIKFDIMVLRNYNVKVKGKLFDTMVAHYLLQPEQRHNMDYLSEVYLKYTPVHIEELIGEKGKQKSMTEVDIETIKEYAAEDADVTWQLKIILEDELRKNNLIDTATNIEMPLINVLTDMEYTGVCINSTFLIQYTEELNKTANEVEQEIYRIAGKEFNIASPKQLGEILFNELKISDNPSVTKSGAYSTGEDELIKYKDKHPIINEILHFRAIKKLVSTYTDALPKLVNTTTGRIHTNFNQTITATGRLSSNNPNIQNIPIRTPEGQKVRAAFVPSKPENYIFAADYSQVELRVLAHLSGDEKMIEAFEHGEDFHIITAAKIFNVDISAVNKEQRSLAKSANFGINYGISAFGLAKDTGISTTEAKKLIDGYFETFAGVRRYMDDTISDCRKNMYVTTMYGHKRNLPDINSRNPNVRNAAERLAINTTIQGTAAEIIKIAMNNIYNDFCQQNLKSKLLIQVHDELVFDVFPEEKDIVEQIVVNNMENAAKLKVKLKVESKFAKNWLDAH